MKTFQRCCSVLLIASTLLALAGCATNTRKDAPWDPKAGQTLFDQMPNWEGAAERICCGHLRSCGPGQSPRC